MRSINDHELSLVTGGSLLDSAGLNTSGAFSGIDSGKYYSAPKPTITNNWGSGRVESINFFTLYGAVAAAGSLAWKHLIDYVVHK